MANFEDFLSNFPYPASYLASAHKDSSEGALVNKKNLSSMDLLKNYWQYRQTTLFVNS